jgi:hypothetical protein
MNNEPVAWIDPKELDMTVSTSVTKNKQFDGDIPLYTHPVKELTDEEIIEQANHLADGWFSNKFEKGIFITEEKLVDLVKAILRKAQK